MRDRRASAGAEHADGGGPAGPGVPGKRTLTDGLTPPAGRGAAGGQPLPAELAGRLGGALGSDVSGVRVHAGADAAAQAEALGTRAFTVGQEIYFGAGNFDPASQAGERLLAHEVAHTVQQARGASSGPQCDPSGGPPVDAHEVEAESFAQAFAGEDGAPGDDSWRGRGNLIGNPPVRDESNPPNRGIVEDAAVYRERHAAAQAARDDQEARADGMLDCGEVTDNRYWFARVYQFVTEGELSHAESATFYYPSYVMQCVRYFERIYANNVDAADAGGTLEEHWRRAFESAGPRHAAALRRACEDEWADLLSIQPFLGDAVAEMLTATRSLVASMQAHIRFDLPRAEAWVFSSHYAGMEDARPADFEPDFMSMAGVFDSAAERMNAEIADQVDLPTDWIPRGLQEWAMTNLYDANMTSERADTWQRAEGLVSEGRAGSDPYQDPGGGAELTGDVTSTPQAPDSGLDNLSDRALRPSMDESAEPRDDNAVRAEVAGGGVEERSSSERIRMLRGLVAGVTLDDDEASIMDILRASLGAGDVVTVVDGAGAWDLGSATDGAENDELRSFLRDHYYAQTTQATALALLYHCIDGETSEWEEEMVADILIRRHAIDGDAILIEIGRHYESGGFNEGVEEIQWQLDGIDQERFDRFYRTR